MSSLHHGTSHLELKAYMDPGMGFSCPRPPKSPNPPCQQTVWVRRLELEMGLATSTVYGV
eukprot:313878-Pyramimonas_sp.AAC.2